MAKQFNIAVAGATGAVGTEMIRTLERAQLSRAGIVSAGLLALGWKNGRLSLRKNRGRRVVRL